jgi:hypothetical protein
VDPYLCPSLCRLVHLLAAPLPHMRESDRIVRHAAGFEMWRRKFCGLRGYSLHKHQAHRAHKAGSKLEPCLMQAGAQLPARSVAVLTQRVLAAAVAWPHRAMAEGASREGTAR